MMEIIIVVGIIVVATGMAARSFYRTMTGRNKGYGCAGNCSGCAGAKLAEPCQEKVADKAGLRLTG